MKCGQCAREVPQSEPFQSACCEGCGAGGFYCARCAARPLCKACRKKAPKQASPAPAADPLARPWPAEANGCPGCVYELRTGKAAVEHACDDQARPVAEPEPAPEEATPEPVAAPPAAQRTAAQEERRTARLAAKRQQRAEVRVQRWNDALAAYRTAYAALAHAWELPHSSVTALRERMAAAAATISQLRRDFSNAQQAPPNDA